MLGNWLRKGSRSPRSSDRLRNAYCSFCRRSHRDIGPLAEGPGNVFICGPCAELCGRLIAEETSRRASQPDPTA